MAAAAIATRYAESLYLTRSEVPSLAWDVERYCTVLYH